MLFAGRFLYPVLGCGDWHLSEDPRPRERQANEERWSAAGVGIGQRPAEVSEVGIGQDVAIIGTEHLPFNK